MLDKRAFQNFINNTMATRIRRKVNSLAWNLVVTILEYGSFNVSRSYLLEQIGSVVLALGRVGAGGTIGLLGTCFAVGTNKLATAAHVVGPSDDKLVAIVGRVNSISEYQDMTNSNVNTIELKIVQYSPFNDVAILEPRVSGIILQLGYSLGSTDDIPTGTPVISLGYPHTDHGRLILTQQSSIVGARLLMGENGQKFKHVVLNTQTRPGQSGGPVFTSDGSKVCAMVTGGYVPSGTAGSIVIGGIDPQSLHQTTHAVSVDYIKELL